MGSSSSPPSVPSPPPRYQPLVVVLAAVCLGMVVDRRFGPPLALSWLTAAATGLGWWALWRKGWDRTAALILLPAVAAVAAGWHHCQWNLFAADDVGHFAVARSEPACVEALVRTGARRLPAPKPNPMEIIPRGDRTRLDVTLVGIRDGAAWRAASGKATLLVDGHLLGVGPGDRIRVFAQLASSTATSGRNPGGFNFGDYLRGERTRGVLRAGYPDSVSVLRRASGWSPRRTLDSIQTSANELLWRYLNRDQTGLAAALLLGDRTDLDVGQTEAFQTTGTIHLIAISGAHVAIVAMLVGGLARLMGLKRKQITLAVFLAAVGYTLLTDSPPSAVRTCVQVGVASLAVLIGRKPLTFNSLAAAGLVVTALNPADLFRIGPQLSFLAVAVILWFAPRWLGRTADPIERLIERSATWTERAGREAKMAFRHVALISMMVWLIAAPLLMARFHLVAPAAPVLNTVLWLPVALALGSGLVVLLSGGICPPLAVAAAWVCDGSLRFADAATQWVHRVLHVHLWVSGPEDWWLVGFYGGLGLMAAIPRLRPPRRWVVGLAAAWIGVGFFASAVEHSKTAGRLECDFLAVGHGCAAVIELPSGGTVLYDAGCMSSPHAGTAAVSGVLWSRGVHHLDAIVLSHADADHFNALPELLERFGVDVVYVSPRMFDEPGRALDALRLAIDQAGVPIRFLQAGDRLRGGPDCRIDVLHPAARSVLGNDNANSLVLCVEHRGRRVLLAGDLEPPGLDDVLAEEPLDCDVLLVPHHGSRNSNPPGLAKWCKPEWAVVSGSLGPTREPEPTETAYRRAGAIVFHTGRVGAVRATIGGGGVSVRAWKAGG